MSEECCQVKISRTDDCLRIEIPAKSSGADVSGCKIGIRCESGESASDCCKEDKEQGSMKGCC